MSRNLTLNFSHTFDGKIWNVLPNEAGDKMVLEIRNDEKMTLSFFIYDFTQNKLQGQIVVEEKWWASIACITNDVVVFKNYDSDANAKVLSYEAYELKGLKKIWVKEGINYVSFNTSTFSCVADSGELQFFDLTTGELVEERSLIESKSGRAVLPPVFYPQSNQYFDTIRRFIDGINGDETVAGAEYLEAESWIGISYYVRNDKLVNKLLVVGMDREVLLLETLAEELSGVGQDTFFVTDNKLIFVKDKSKLFIYQ
ncbi:MAG: DUF4905 domain-containing protein [Fulvivirga sp.]